jgi:hypothetical protein
MVQTQLHETHNKKIAEKFFLSFQFFSSYLKRFALRGPKQQNFLVKYSQIQSYKYIFEYIYLFVAS